MSKAKNKVEQVEQVDLVATAIDSGKLASQAIGASFDAMQKFVIDMAAIKKDWHEVKTFDPAKSEGKTSADVEVNKVRVALRDYDLTVRKVGDKHGSDSWNKAKEHYRKKLAGDAVGSKIGEGNRGTRAPTRSEAQVISDAILAYADYLGRQTKKGLNTFEASMVDLINKQKLLIVEHGIKTGTTKK